MPPIQRMPTSSAVRSPSGDALDGVGHVPDRATFPRARRPSRTGRRRRTGSATRSSTVPAPAGLRVTSRPIAAPVERTVAGSTPEQLVDEEREDRRNQDRDGAPQLACIPDRSPGIQLHHQLAILRRDLQLVSVVEIERPMTTVNVRTTIGPRLKMNSLKVRPRGPGDDDVRRVADQRRRAADIGRDDLDDRPAGSDRCRARRRAGS